MRNPLPSGYTGTKKLAKDLADPQHRDSWLQRVKACYELTGETGYEEFAKRWLPPEFRHAPFSLRKLQSYGILEKVGESVRCGHRAYYRMPDRDGVGRALGELDCL